MKTKRKMTIGNKLKRIIAAASALVVAVSLTFGIAEGAHRRSLQKQLKEQSVIIDSLLRRPKALMDVQLYVTDKSVNKIYGRYNKGFITMPQERRYILEVDSVRTTLTTH